MKLSLLVATAFAVLIGTNSYQILFMLPTAGPSQMVLLMALIEGLAERNHTCTVLTTTPGKSSHPNVHIHQTKAVGFPPEVIRKIMESVGQATPVQEVADFFEDAEESCKIFYELPKTQEILAAGKHQYDLVLVDTAMGECGTAIAPLVSPLVMYASSGPLMPWTLDRVNVPPSYVPSYFVPYSDKMNFWQRMKNAYIYSSIRLYYELFGSDKMQAIVSRHIPNAPTVREAEKMAHFVLANHDPVLFSPRPAIPNVIYAGGYHCRPGKPVPKDLEDFIQSSGKDGFIMFGLGSNARSEFIGKEAIQALLRVFSRLKQKVIWKFEAKLDNLPANVKIVSWMPQQDLLAHPKIKLFITHGGTLSLQEAVYHAIPVIGVPLFFDQPGNVARMVELGIGEHLGFRNITEDWVYHLITKILNNKSYYDNMKKHSAIFKDFPETALERAIFWTEYVIRHNGALHLRPSGADLNFFQYFLLDVIAFVLLVVTAVLILFAFAVKLALRAIRRGGAKKKTEKKKRH